MSLPILIKPLSFRLGLFYYFRFALKRYRFHIVILLLLIISKEYIAQNIDTTLYEKVNTSYDSLLSSDFNNIDSLFYKHKNNTSINNIGPFGSPFYYPTTFYLFQKKLLLDKDLFLAKFYSLNGVKPFTNISYLNASRKEQIISIKHIQQLGKQLRFSFNLRKVSSPGAYVNQEANNTLFNLNLDYSSKSNRYQVVFTSEIQRDFFELNGGLIDIENFGGSIYDSERSYKVNLPTSNSYLKRYKFGLTQRLDLLRFSQDSLSKKAIYLKYNTEYQSKTNVFYDNESLSKIYSAILIDSLSTVDSIYSNNFSNTVFLGVRNSKSYFEILYEYDFLNYYQTYGLDTNYTIGYTGFAAGIDFNNSDLKGIVKYGLNGYRKGEFLSEFHFAYVSDKYNLLLNGGYFMTVADLKMVNYNSNHFSWKNYDFDKQNMIDFSTTFEWKKPQLEFLGEVKSLSNAFYYDTLSQANQYEKNISFFSLSLAKKYSFLNFHFKSALIYQLTSNDKIIPLPEIIGRQIAYYQKYIFKGALKIQLGIGFSYSTDYYGYAFMPALSEFYVQENKRLGYYPSVDIFLNTHLKRAQIFLKYEHINAGNSLDKSYLVLGYPELNKSLKFGVSWNLFD